MTQHGLSLLFTVLIWWLSTGIVILLCALPKRSFGISLFGAGLVAVASVYGLYDSARSLTESAAYVAFLSALGVWAWAEMSFLMGFVTGPHRLPCPPELSGWPRFRMALGALLYHELSILAGAVLIMAVTWGAPNQTGTLTFLVLMVMRISAKLNIFLGVPNLTDEFLPERLSYLKSYFRKREFNWLFPISILVAASIGFALWQRISGEDSAQSIGAALVLTLVSLAMLEHFFMIMPLPDAALWRWAVPVSGTKSIEKPLP